MSAERWLPVVGFEGLYEVSDLGRVRSLDRIVARGGRGDYSGNTRLAKGRVLKPVINRKRGGYRYVNLLADGAQTLRRVCVLVLAAFVGPRPAGQETRHRNGNAQDDRLDNLLYGTPKENAEDRKRHGTHAQGETAPNARLTESIVKHILASKADAETLGARYGVHPGHINNIRRGARWSHVRV